MKKSDDGYYVLWATIDKSPYAQGESFRVGKLAGWRRKFKDAFVMAKVSADIQIRSEVAAMTGKEPNKREMNEARVRMIERPSDSSLLVRLAHSMTLYKVWKDKQGDTK